MAEQAVNTIYLLGEQPDLLCGTIIKNLTEKAFNAPKPESHDMDAEGSQTPRRNDRDQTPTPYAQDAIDDAATPRPTQDVPPTPATLMGSEIPPTPSQLDRSPSKGVDASKDDSVAAFTLAQLVFVVGHTAIKHIVYLELVEREFKRRKDETAKS